MKLLNDYTSEQELTGLLRAKAYNTTNRYDMSHPVSRPLGRVRFPSPKKTNPFLHKHPETPNMINALPDLVLALIFGFLPEAERICTIALVCKKWYDIVYSCAFWRKVDFYFQLPLTSDALRKYVFPGTRKIFLSKCHNLDWIFATFYADAEALKFWFWPG